MDEQLKALQEAFEAKIKEAASKVELETIKSEMAEQIKAIKVGVSDEQLKEAQLDFDTKLKAQWEAVELKLKSKEVEKPLSFYDKLKAAFVEANLFDGDTLKTPASEKENVRVKVAFDMNTAGTTASVATGYQTNYGMMSQELLMSTDIEMLDVFGHMPLAAIERYMAKVVEYEETDGADIKVETGAAGDSSFKLKTEDFKVFDYGVKFRVHRNMLKTWAGLQNRIQTIGIDRLRAKISTFVIDAGAAGDGTATPYGLLSTGKYTAYDVALRAGEVQSADIVDVIKNAVLQAKIAKKPINAIILNSIDVAELESLKDLDNNSVVRAGLKVDETGKLSYIYGLRVIETAKITTNTCIFVNTLYAGEFGDKFSLEVLMGYDKTEDFSKGIVTIQLETELAFGLGDPLAIIYCDNVSAAAGLLTKVGA